MQTPSANIENHGMLYGEYEIKQKTLKKDQQRTSSDVERRNLIGQWPGSNSSVRKLLQLIYRGSIYREEPPTKKKKKKKIANEILPRI